MARGPKERAYDERIAPLMTRVLDIAKECGIPVIASFALDALSDEPDDREYCSSYLAVGAPPKFERAWRALLEAGSVIDGLAPGGKIVVGGTTIVEG